MKLILKQHLSGANGAFEIGDTIEVTENEAIAYIEKGIAEFKTKKEHDAFIAKVEEIKQKKAEAEAKAKAILEESRIKNELNELYLAVVLKEAELSGDVLNEKETLEAVEALAKRDAMVTKKAKVK